MEVIDNSFVLFGGIHSLLWQHWSNAKKKKRWTLGKQKVLKFYLSFLSTTVLELSWVEYYDPRCTQLNSNQPPVVLNSTQSNQVGSWVETLDPIGKEYQITEPSNGFLDSFMDLLIYVNTCQTRTPITVEWNTICPFCSCLWYPGFQGVYWFTERPSIRLRLPDRFTHVSSTLSWSQRNTLSSSLEWNFSILRESTKTIRYGEIRQNMVPADYTKRLPTV